MLSTLTTKAQAASNPIWKWVLGLSIGLLLLFAGWRLYRMYRELVRLRVEKALAADLAKDAQVAAEKATSDQQVDELKKIAESHLAAAKDLEAKEAAQAKEIEEAKQIIDAAKSWKELNEAVKK